MFPLRKYESTQLFSSGQRIWIKDRHVRHGKWRLGYVSERVSINHQFITLRSVSMHCCCVISGTAHGRPWHCDCSVTGLFEFLTFLFFVSLCSYYKSLYIVFTLVLPTTAPMYLWDETLINAFLCTFFARYIVQLNFTWSVNSVAHIWGNKPYDKWVLEFFEEKKHCLSVC